MFRKLTRNLVVALVAILALPHCAKKTPSLIGNVTPSSTITTEMAAANGFVAANNCIQWVRYSDGTNNIDMAEFSNLPCPAGLTLANRNAVVETLNIVQGIGNVWKLIENDPSRPLGYFTLVTGQYMLLDFCEFGADTATDYCDVAVLNGAITGIRSL